MTGLTSNPTIFDHAIKNSDAYDAGIREILAKGKTGEGLFFDLALDDLSRAAGLFRPVYDRTNGVDGWVSLEVSPVLAYNTASTIAAAKDLFARLIHILGPHKSTTWRTCAPSLPFAPAWMSSIERLDH